MIGNVGFPAGVLFFASELLVKGSAPMMFIQSAILRSITELWPERFHQDSKPVSMPSN
jgi:hypothetical protein